PLRLTPARSDCGAHHPFESLTPGLIQAQLSWPSRLPLRAVIKLFACKNFFPDPDVCVGPCRFTPLRRTVLKRVKVVSGE
ncbi:hypothetical protein, partial [Erwinia amylovora]|uniref:hypothetical protein n=1 Tax=Erwinia amylovora TaxID=552 RepID=UPI001C559034